MLASSLRLWLQTEKAKIVKKFRSQPFYFPFVLSSEKKRREEVRERERERETQGKRVIEGRRVRIRAREKDEKINSKNKRKGNIERMEEM